MAPSTKLEIIFGAMTFGREGQEQVRTSDLDDCAAILDIFQRHGHTEIDTARFYGSGSSEEYLGALGWQNRGLVVDTKYYPNIHGIMRRPVTHHDEKGLRDGLDASLKALNAESLDLWYLHAPDRTIPIEETLKGVYTLYKEGKFKRWGISNYMSWEVANICDICDKEGYPRPSVYQGLYNAFHRVIEQELIPCLRHYNISFYAFNPLAGGILTSRYHRDSHITSIKSGSRFDQNSQQGKMYRARYWNDKSFDALDNLRPVLKQEGLRESEAALRWIVHHSALKRDNGDKIIIGASSAKQLEENLLDFEGPELSENVVQALDQGWAICKGVAGKYFH